MTVIDLRPKKRRRGRCATCLWHWPELQSPSYHQEPPNSCGEYVRRVVAATKCNKYKAVWGNPGTPYHRNKGAIDEKQE